MDKNERLAVALAECCNGGAWETHFTDAQRELWRQRARRVIRFADELDLIGDP